MAHISISNLKPVAALFLLTGGLAACAGGGIPTPPGDISNAPQSIMATQPPVDQQVVVAQPAQQQAVAPVYVAQPASTNGLPPASSLGRVNATTPNRISPMAPSPVADIPTNVPGNPSNSSTASVAYKAPVSSTVLTFEPMVGAPKSVARELSGSLGLRVAQHNLPVVARSDSKVTHRIKGYFSATQSAGNVEVSYVWDIFDKSGKRINRVTGAQRAPMSGGEPWDSVKGPILDKVAVDTAAKLKTWHSSL